MIQSNSGALENLNEPKLSRRDWLLLPMISLLTVCLIAGFTELIARQVFSASKTLIVNCMVMDDPSTGPRAIPNSVCWEKVPEGQLIEYRFNRCGHRAGTECGPKPPGTYEIVMAGSSVVLGELMPRGQTFAALLPAELSRQTGRSVELYNEGMGWGFSHSVALRFNEVMAANPDMVLWPLTPGDIEGASLVVTTNKPEIDARRYLSLPAKAWLRVKASFSSKWDVATVSELFGRTRSALLLRHFLYQSQNQYVKSYLMGADEEAGFLRADLSAEWKGHLLQFDRDAAEIEGRTRAAGIPFVATFLPNRAEAAMISMGEWPAGYDPYKLDDELRTIITRHGGIYIDILPDYREIPNPEQEYFAVDGHPNADGHAMIAKFMAKALTGGVVPALKVSTLQQADLK